MAGASHVCTSKSLEISVKPNPALPAPRVRINIRSACANWWGQFASYPLRSLGGMFFGGSKASLAHD